MIIMCCLTRNLAKGWIKLIQQQKRRIPKCGLAPAVGSLADLVGMSIGGMIHDIEPKHNGLTDPYGGVRDEQSLPTKIMMSRVHFRGTYRKGPRIQQPQIPSVIVLRGELLLQVRMSRTKERKRILNTILKRTVRIAGHIAMLVMTTMLRRPPDRSTLMRHAAQQVEEELRARSALEGGMGGVAVETHGHGNAHPPNGNAEC